jgi:hypothetical protein
MAGQRQPSWRASTDDISLFQLKAATSIPAPAECFRHQNPGVAGPTLAAAAMRAGLIDEYAIVTHPVLLGAARRSSRPWTTG